MSQAPRCRETRHSFNHSPPDARSPMPLDNGANAQARFLERWSARLPDRLRAVVQESVNEDMARMSPAKYDRPASAAAAATRKPSFEQPPSDRFESPTPARSRLSHGVRRVGDRKLKAEIAKLKEENRTLRRRAASLAGAAETEAPTRRGGHRSVVGVQTVGERVGAWRGSNLL